jgi:hypothetical protein
VGRYDGHFTNEMRTDSSTPVWLENAHILTWLAGQRKKKDRRKKANAEQSAKFDGGGAGNRERPVKKARAASEKPAASAKPEVAPKAAPKAASKKPAARYATKQTPKQANEQESKAGAPKRTTIAGRDSK